MLKWLAVLSIPKHRARRSSPVSIPSRFIFVVVAGPTPWNFSIGKFSTKVSPIFGVMTKRPSGLFRSEASPACPDAREESERPRLVKGEPDRRGGAVRQRLILGEAGERHDTRLSTPSQRRQCGDFTLRTLVTPGSDFFPLRANAGDGMPQRAIISSRPSG